MFVLPKNKDNSVNATPDKLMVYETYEKKKKIWIKRYINEFNTLINEGIDKQNQTDVRISLIRIILHKGT